VFSAVIKIQLKLWMIYANLRCGCAINNLHSYHVVHLLDICHLLFFWTDLFEHLCYSKYKIHKHSTVQYSTERWIRVTDMALKWLKSYIEDRQKFVKFGRHSSATVRCTSCVPQGSVLGPLIFVAHVSLIGVVISNHGVDAQLFFFSNIHSYLSTLEVCSQAVKHWFSDNGLLQARSDACRIITIVEGWIRH